MSSLKFKNPGEQPVRISLESGHGAEFPPGATVEVPELMKSACLAHNLTLVAEKELTAKERKAQEAAAAKAAAAEADAQVASDDNESTVNAG